MAINEKQRIWVISELYYPEETSTGYYLTKIAEGLASDADVRVLCGQPTYSKRGTRAPQTELHKGVSITRVKGTTLNKDIILFRIVNMLSLGAGILFVGLLRFAKGDRILVVTTPPIMPFIIAIASLIKGCSYYLLIHDSYPELLVAVGKTRKGSLFYRVAERANRWLYKHSSKIIVVARDMAERTLAKTRGLDIPIITIPNWAELEAVEPRPRDENQLIKELGLQDKVIFLYAGNMGHPNDIESIVTAAYDLRETKAHFIFLGTGVKRKWLECKLAGTGIENVTLLDPRPRDEQMIFLNACDIAIVTLVAGMKGVSMPSRTYNILAAGKPILAITEEGSEVDRVVNENQIGWTVTPNKPEELASLIRSIINVPDQFREMALRSRDAAISEYSESKAIAAYRNVMIGSISD